MMTELSPAEIKAQGLYLQWGLSEDEFQQVEKIL